MRIKDKKHYNKVVIHFTIAIICTFFLHQCC